MHLPNTGINNYMSSCISFTWPEWAQFKIRHTLNRQIRRVSNKSRALPTCFRRIACVCNYSSESISDYAGRFWVHRSYDLGMTQKRGDKGRARLSASRGETRMVHEVPEASHRLPDSKESNVWCLSSLKKSCPAQCNQRCHEKVGSCQRTFLSTKIVSSLLNTLPQWKPSSLPSAGQRGRGWNKSLVAIERPNATKNTFHLRCRSRPSAAWCVEDFQSDIHYELWNFI